ncbi:hypothetical protein K7432_011947 [Basidiobolus ranarum]|uniref:Terpene synthase n=1 Tax=Basidiobolus ranarum TaxID=34480 RepID=A0ABR2VT36_9FUNG
MLENWTFIRFFEMHSNQFGTLDTAMPPQVSANPLISRFYSIWQVNMALELARGYINVPPSRNTRLLKNQFLMKIAIRDFDFLPPTSLSPEYKEIERETVEWLTQKQLIRGKEAVERLVRSKLTNLACRVHITVKYDRMLWIAKLFSWLFMFDDQFDDSELGQDKIQMYIIFIALLNIFNTSETKRVTSEYAQNVESLMQNEKEGKITESFAEQMAQVQDSPIYISLSELWVEFCQTTSVELQENVTSKFIKYLNAYIFECDMRQMTRYPDVETYIKNRQDSGSMRLCLEAIEFIEEISLPKEIYTCELIDTLRDQCINVVCWVNDIYSFEKEYENGDIHNLVMVLNQVKGISIDESVKVVEHMVNKEMEDFFETKAAVEKMVAGYPAQVKKDVAQYIIVLEAWCRGNMDWSIESARFKKGVQSKVYLEEILSNKVASTESNNDWVARIKMLSQAKPALTVINGLFYGMIVIAALGLYHIG